MNLTFLLLEYRTYLAWLDRPTRGGGDGEVGIVFFSPDSLSNDLSWVDEVVKDGVVNGLKIRLNHIVVKYVEVIFSKRIVYVLALIYCNIYLKDA